MNVYAVFVDERCVRALPGGDATAARSQCNEGGLDPRSAVSVEKVGLTGDLTVVEVRVPERPDIDLDTPRSTSYRRLARMQLTVSW